MLDYFGEQPLLVRYHIIEMTAIILTYYVVITILTS